MNSQKYIIFGWVINKNTFVNGEQTSFVWLEDFPIDSSANWLFWTKGARVGITYPEDLNDDFLTRQRGRFLNKTTFAGYTYKKGKYVFSIVGDTEVWCLDYALNNNSAPSFEFVLLEAGQSYVTSVGQLILIASGQTNFGGEPTSLEIVSENKIISATTQASLIIFSRKK